MNDVEAEEATGAEYEGVLRDEIREGRAVVEEVDGWAYAMAVCCCIGGAKASMLVLGKRGDADGG